MARLATFFIAFALTVSQLAVQAAPLAARAGLGDFIQCNLARLQTVTGLAATTSAVQKLATAAGSADAATSSSVSAAQTGLKDAQGGIAAIAKALLSGQAPPADARDQVGSGLNAAQTALNGISSTDPNVTAQVQAAQTKLKQTISAGQQVVDTCGGGGAAGTSLSSVATVSMTATEITTAATLSISASLTDTASQATLTASASTVEVTATDCAAVSTVTSFVTVTAQPTNSPIVSATEPATETSLSATGQGGARKL